MYGCEEQNKVYQKKSECFINLILFTCYSVLFYMTLVIE